MDVWLRIAWARAGETHPEGRQTSADDVVSRRQSRGVQTTSKGRGSVGRVAMRLRGTSSRSRSSSSAAACKFDEHRQEFFHPKAPLFLAPQSRCNGARFAERQGLPSLVVASMRLRYAMWLRYRRNQTPSGRSWQHLSDLRSASISTPLSCDASHCLWSPVASVRKSRVRTKLVPRSGSCQISLSSGTCSKLLTDGQFIDSKVIIGLSSGQAQG